MVSRYYICDHCNYRFKKEQKLHDKILKKCPSCKSMSLYQDLTGQHTFVYQEPKTVGHLAQKNTEQMGKYELEQKRKDLPKKSQGKKTWYNPEGENLKNKLSKLDTKEKQQKYIMTGDE